MKSRDIKALHEKSVADLNKDLGNKQRELTKLKLERRVKQMKNTRQSRILSDEIARIETVIKENKLKEKK